MRPADYPAELLDRVVELLDFMRDSGPVPEWMKREFDLAWIEVRAIALVFAPLTSLGDSDATDPHSCGSPSLCG